MILTGQRVSAGALWLAAAGGVVLGRRLPGQVAQLAIAAAAVATSVTLSCELTARQGDRLATLAAEQGDRTTDVILARLAAERHIGELGPQERLKVAR
jgi:hypothetical protein